MTPAQTLSSRTVRHSRLLQKGSLAALASGIILILAFGRHSVFLAGLALALCLVAVPALYVTGRRYTAQAVQRETDTRLAHHTLAYLHHHVADFALTPPLASDLEVLETPGRNS